MGSDAGQRIGKPGNEPVRKYARQDANSKELTAAFKRMGCSVADLSALGGGIADALIGYGGLSILCEYKDASKPPSARKLTPDQEKFRMNWTGGYRLVKDLDDVLATVSTLKVWRAAIIRQMNESERFAFEGGN